MARNFVYRMNHDTGFAPKVKHGMCTLSGCKNRTSDGRRNIEELAEKDDWVIAVGGNYTGQSNRLIYAMEVEDNLSKKEFLKKYPTRYSKSERSRLGENVVISKSFYYLGDNAVTLPRNLKKLIFDRQGFKSKGITSKDIENLKKYLSKSGFRKYGAHGKPNNP